MVLKRGSKGESVKALQQKLIDLEHLAPTYKKGKQTYSNIDGDFGSGTQKAVKAWQKAVGRKQTGEVTLAEQIALGIATMPKEPRTKHYNLSHVNSCPTRNMPTVTFTPAADAFYRKAAKSWTDCPVELWDEAQKTLEMLEAQNDALNAKYAHPAGTEYIVFPFSIYRGPAYNKAVGSTSNRHTGCYACDGWAQLVDAQTGRVIQARADLNNLQYAETAISVQKLGGFGLGDNMILHSDRLGDPKNPGKTFWPWWYEHKGWASWRVVQTRWAKEL